MTPEEMAETLIRMNQWNFINGADKTALRARTTELFTLARTQALEEAARVADNEAASAHDSYCCIPLAKTIAAAIRALKPQKDDGE